MAAPKKTSGTTAEAKAEDTQTKTEADNPAPKAEAKTEAKAEAKAEVKTEDKPKSDPKPAGKTKAEDKKDDGKLSEVQRRGLSAAYDPVVIDDHTQASQAAMADQNKIKKAAPVQIRNMDTSHFGRSVLDATASPRKDGKRNK